MMILSVVFILIPNNLLAYISGSSRLPTSRDYAIFFDDAANLADLGARGILLADVLNNLIFNFISSLNFPT